ESREGRCGQMAETRAVRLSRLGLLQAEHALFDVVHYAANDFVTDDFRSALAFEEVARSPFLMEAVSKRKLTIVYPASGAHLTPLVLPMKLIDDQRIEEAKLLYFEINGAAAIHAVHYLKWFEEHQLIAGLKIGHIQEGERESFNCRFLYRGKKVELH